jgi:hypothetical protein
MSSIVSQSFASPQDASVLCKDTFNIHSFICRKETDCQSRVRERSSVTHSHSWPCRCRNTTGGAERECDGNITSRTSDQRLDHLSIFESITIWGWRGTSRVFECHRDVESSWVIHSSIRFRHWRVRSWWPKGATSRHIPQSCWGLAFPTSNSIYIYITEYIYISVYQVTHLQNLGTLRYFEWCFLGANRSALTSGKVPNGAAPRQREALSWHHVHVHIMSIISMIYDAFFTSYYNICMIYNIISMIYDDLCMFVIVCIIIL